MEVMTTGQLLEEEMSYDQMADLLKGAENRLRSLSNSASNALILSPADQEAAKAAIPKLSVGKPLDQTSYLRSTKHGTRVESKYLVDEKTRHLAGQVRKVNDLVMVKKPQEDKKPNAGPDWFDIPRTDLTPELKRDLQLLRMRSVLDPKRHYKKDSSNRNYVPEFSQIGTVIQGPTEYFSARLNNKERKRTLVEEVLAGEKNSQRFRSKYNEIQAAKTSGRKAHYKAVKAQRQRRTKG